ncbi:hypothetical protein Sru01_36030 [Sphaerisporangium rufum]|uniref:Uncharacterized protein n=1 Tax=Sphaerisporangium rufum TaxID=1381558 RepID=A0A919R2Q2_9ACTN|nr:DUF5335 family protein [Sphaerisporangium rufum]GII78621.1 hypothetical protein Sru01_36030 [Sphaerisporangium rufum]
MQERRPELPRERWREFFDTMTREHLGSAMTVEVLGADIGDQMDAERVPLAYLEYDAKDDQFAIGLGGEDGRHPVVTRHAIDHPRQIMADTVQHGSVQAIEIIDEAGTRTIITIHPAQGPA